MFQVRFVASNFLFDVIPNEFSTHIVGEVFRFLKLVINMYYF